jgi:hypothetical protein
MLIQNFARLFGMNREMNRVDLWSSPLTLGVIYWRSEVSL